jgi:methionyl-tRNA formyltransferase
VARPGLEASIYFFPHWSFIVPEEIIRDDPNPVARSGEPMFFTRRGPEDGNLLTAESLDGVYDLIRMLDAEGSPPAFPRQGGFEFTFSNAFRDTEDEVTAMVRIGKGRE